MDNWRSTSLLEEIDLLTGFPFKSDEYTDDSSGIKLLRGDNVVQGRLRWDGAKLWPRTRLEACERYLLDAGDVVLAMDRPWIEAGLKYARLTAHDLPALLVQRVARLRGGDSLDQRFLYYLIGSKAFTDHVLAVQTGTAVPHISGKQIQSFEFNLPPLDEQRAIVSVLGSLDDKIELNRRMNRTLEQMAAAIFKAWFVDFEPVRAKASGAASFPGMPQPVFDALPATFADSELGPIPKGWKVGVLGDNCEINRQSVGNGEFDGEIEYIDIASVTVGHLDGVARYRFSDAPSRARRRIRHGDTLWSCVRPNRRSYLFIHNPPTSRLASTGFAVLSPGRFGPAFLYCLVTRQEFVDYLVANADGSAYPAVRADHFAAASVVVPDTSAVEAFDRAAMPLRDLIAANDAEAATLAETRDALLPKLLSGEVRLRALSSGSDAESIAPSIHQIMAMARLADELESAPTPKWPELQRSGNHQAVMPVLDNGPAIERFEQQAYEHGFVIDFDWTGWQEQAGQYFSDPARLAKADVHTIQRLVTTSIRKERFCEGTLVSLHANGVLAAICRRLGQIAKESSK